jgi:hypothetical protein
MSHRRQSAGPSDVWSTWQVQLLIIIYEGPFEAQAENLVSAVAADERIHGAPNWRHIPSWLELDGVHEQGAISMRCTVLASDEEDAQETANRVLALGIESLVVEDPPGLLVPVLTDVKVQSHQR